jgi:hypothetical protein
MAPLKPIQNWLDRPQRTNRDALVVGVVGAAIFAIAVYALGRLLDAAHLIDFDSSIPVWIASLGGGGALGLGLLLGRRSVRGLRDRVGALTGEVDRLEEQTSQLQQVGPYSEHQPTVGTNKAIKRRPGRVEAELVYPVLRGREVGRWTAEPARYMFAPYRQNAMGSGLSNDEFRKSFPNGYRWLAQFRSILRDRKLVATLNWDMNGDDWGQVMGTEHMTGRPCVVVREMAKRPAAAVVTKRYDPRLGRSATVLVDHKLLICAVDTRTRRTTSRR